MQLATLTNPTRKGFKTGDKFICKICGGEDFIDDGQEMTKAVSILEEWGIRMGLPTVCRRCDDLMTAPRKVYRNGIYEEKPPYTLDALIAEKNYKKPRRLPLVVPPEYVDTDPARLPDLDAYRKTMKWRIDKKGLILHGDSYSGKTRSAWCLMAKLWGEGVNIVAIDAGEFSNTVSDKFKNGWGNYYLNRLIKAPLVFIDDLGNEARGDRAEGSLFTMIKIRVEKRLPCVITTQRTRDQLIDGAIDKQRMLALVNRLRENYDDVPFTRPPEPDGDKPK